MNYIQFWSSYWKQWADLTVAPEQVETTAAPEDFSANEKYGYLAEYGTQILCLLSPEGGCSYLSPNFEKHTGHANGFLGEEFFSLVQEDYRDKLKSILATPGSKSQPVRCKLMHADGQWYWYLLMMHPKRGNTCEYVCIMENINDTMLAQNTLQKARLEAELALRARSEFLANMSHDLRTPLNAVIGFAQIIESEMFGKLQNPQYIEYVKHIQESGHDLLAKIEDLLEIANIDAGRVSLDKEEVMMSDILKHVVEAQMHHAYSARVALQMVCPKNDIRLYVDRLKLQHIMGHLVSNALENCREGGSIILEAGKAAGGALALHVRDNGNGMPKQKLAAINAALKEDNCWTAGTNQSIGLGLALTREFVALHSGQMTLESSPENGTSVHITLPKECIVSGTTQKSDYLQHAIG